jgi:4-amino-4-deoxy-L-arabinose transferase-like glycosyltransferase
MKIGLKTIILILILFLALALRLYRIADTQTFLEDEGRDMLMVQRMLDTKTPVLLGPQTSTGNMYLGPFYYYFITPGLVLSGGHPVGPAILIALTGVLTVYLLFRFAQTWFSYRVAISAAALYALLPYPVMFTRNSWNPNLVPLIMLLLLYVTTKLDLKEKTRRQLVYLFSFGALSGIIVQLHYMALVGVGALGLYLILKNLKAWRRFPLALVTGILGFVLLVSPFILFELRNDFVNSQALVGFTTGTTEDNLRYDLTFSAWGGKVFQIALALSSAHLGGARFMASEPLRYVFLIFLLLLYPLIFFRRNNRHPTTTLLAFVIFTSFLVLGFYQENIHLHYLGFLLPLIYLFVVGALATLHVKSITLLVTIAFILYNSPHTLQIPKFWCHQSSNQG